MQHGQLVGPQLKALRKQTGLSVREVAARLGLPAHTSYTYYEGTKFKGPTLPMKIARPLAELFAERGVPAEKVLALAGIQANEPDGEVDSNIGHTEQNHRVMARLAEVDVRPSAGGGTIMSDIDSPETIREWEVPRDLIRAATYATPDRIRIITVVGDSMEGTFRPFEKVMVDTTDTVPSPPGIFVVYDGLGLVVKRVEHIPHSEPPRVRISSDNPRYEPYERVLGEAYIQGRVLGRWQWV